MIVYIDMGQMVSIAYVYYKQHAEKFMCAIAMRDKDAALIEGQKSIDWLKSMFKMIDADPKQTQAQKDDRKKHFYDYVKCVEEATKEIMEENDA